MSILIVLKRDSIAFELKFLNVCEREGVSAYLTAEAAAGFPQYHLTGPQTAVNYLLKTFGRIER